MEATKEQILSRIKESVKEIEQAFSTFVYSKSDWDNRLRITPLYKNIEREGIRI